MKAVIKIGGSLQGSEILPEVCEKISYLASQNSFIVVPGGGRGADLVRELQKKHGLSEKTSHFMAVKSMEIYGLLLGEFLPGLSFVENLEDLEGGSIFLPFKPVWGSGELEFSWKVTSDSIAAWSCGKAGYSNLILVKKVDGISNNGLISNLTTSELKNMHQTVVDSKLPEFLEDYAVTCWIVNGEYPERLEELVKSQKCRSTKIVPEGRV